LVTSRHDLEDIYAGLLEEDLTQPLILQEDDAAATFKTFMTTPHSVLIGMKSFWEGVDVQGSKLQLVVITKLPFPTPKDPVLQARARQLIASLVDQGVEQRTAESAVFSRLHVPHMLMELRQGAGRLIRSTTDFGVLAILDTRVFTGNSTGVPTQNQEVYKGYGKTAIDATGFKNPIYEFDLVERMLAQLNAHHATTPSPVSNGTGTPAGTHPFNAAEVLQNAKRNRPLAKHQP
jgi:Rad3-related DNA helicase